MNQEMTIQHAIEVYYILKGIIDDTRHDIDPLCKFRLLGIIKCLQSHVQHFDVIKNELIMKYGTKDENGNYTVNRDDVETMNKINHELTPILNSTVSPDITPLKPEEIFNQGIPSEYLISLYELIASN